MLEIMVSAGEVSGDKNAAAVVRHLKSIYTDLKIWGIGGTELAAEGVELISNTVDKSSMGITEPLINFCYYLSVLKALKKKIASRKPTLILLVDFTYFNMKVAKCAYKHSIPTISYFSPSAWVWGLHRAVKMTSWNVRIAAVFGMEYDAYYKAGAQVRFVGHPLPYEIKHRMKTQLTAFIDTNRKIIGLLPGSRKQEVESLFALFLEVAEIIHQRHPDCIFIIPAATTALKSYMESTLKKRYDNLPIYLLDGMSLDVMEAAKLIISASGTALLEAACICTPFVAAYKVSFTSYLFIKIFVKASYMSLPNIILDKPMFPEFFQGKAESRNISEAALRLLEDDEYYQEQKLHLQKAVSRLGLEDSALKTAGYIKDIIEGKA